MFILAMHYDGFKCNFRDYSIKEVYKNTNTNF